MPEGFAIPAYDCASPTSITSFEGATFEVAVLDGAAACADMGAALAGAGATFSGENNYGSRMLWVKAGGRLTLIGITLERNQCCSNAIDCDGGSCTFTGCSFVRNYRAVSCNYAIFWCTFTGCSFVSNDDQALWAWNSAVSVTGCVFDSNSGVREHALSRLHPI